MLIADIDCDITVTTDGVKHSVSSSCNKPPAKKPANPVKKPAATPANPVKKPAVTKPKPAPTQSYFKNCDALRKVYPSGVRIGHPTYAKKHDRDGDGYACE